MHISSERRNKLVLHTLKSVPWQYPAITEKAAYECLHRNPGLIEAEYIALPWATILDWQHNAERKFNLTTSPFQKLKKDVNVFTVCQHIHYRRLCRFFSSIGINVCFACHATTEDIEMFAKHNIRLMPFPLFAVNTVNPENERDLLYSFVGMVDHTLLMSDLRRRLLTMEHPANTYVRGREKWHYENRVYKEQVLDIQMTAEENNIENSNALEFMDVLRRSRYSLCPSGTGPNSIRFWESLAAGAIPVLLSDKMLLPEHDWDRCIVRVPEDNLEKVQQILRGIPMEKESMMRARCLDTFKLYSGNSFASVVSDYYSDVKNVVRQ